MDQRKTIEINRRYEPNLGYAIKITDENGTKDITSKDGKRQSVPFPKAVELLVGLPSSFYKSEFPGVNIEIRDVPHDEERTFRTVIKAVEKITVKSEMYKSQRDSAEGF
jgi:hypothetical protein